MTSVKAFTSILWVGVESLPPVLMLLQQVLLQAGTLGTMTETSGIWYFLPLLTFLLHALKHPGRFTVKASHRRVQSGSVWLPVSSSRVVTASL